MTDVTQNLIDLRSRIARTCADHDRDPANVTLLAVSKGHPADQIRRAAADGQSSFGENMVQEALAKQAELSDLDVEWHFIGRIQSNKTRDIATGFDWVHSVDRAKIAQRLNDQRSPDGPRLNVCLQVLLETEPGKSGVFPGDLPALAADVAAMPQLRLRGLMCIPPPSSGFEQQRLWFATLRRLSNELNAVGYPLDTLSMGMSNDLEAAIAEGATILRIGTGVFGTRPDKTTSHEPAALT